MIFFANVYVSTNKLIFRLAVSVLKLTRMQSLVIALNFQFSLWTTIFTDSNEVFPVTWFHCWVSLELLRNWAFSLRFHAFYSKKRRVKPLFNTENENSQKLKERFNQLWNPKQFSVCVQVKWLDEKWDHNAKCEVFIAIGQNTLEYRSSILSIHHVLVVCHQVL